MTQFDQPIIEFKQVNFGWDQHNIFHDLDITIPQGKITTIMGPSGSGKTTLLRLIGGQYLAQTGNVLVQGNNVATIKREQLYSLRKQMGMMFQNSALFTDLTVFENVAFPLRAHTKLSNDIIRTLVLMKLQAVGLRGARTLKPFELSGGMVRRVALARAIILDPNIIMYDDPFSGQDPISVGVLMRLIRTINDGLGLTSVIVSHDVEEVAAISDQLYLIAEGSVKQHGTPNELAQSTDPWVQQFLHGDASGPVEFHYPAKDYAADLLSIA